MKKFFYLLTLAAFVFSVTVAAAQGPAQPSTPAKPGGETAVKGVNCCIKGACKSLPNEMDCTKQGGKVVKDCKECK